MRPPTRHAGGLPDRLTRDRSSREDTGERGEVPSGNQQLTDGQPGGNVVNRPRARPGARPRGRSFKRMADIAPSCDEHPGHPGF